MPWTLFPSVLSAISSAHPHYPFLSPKQQLPPFSLQYCLVPFLLHHALILSSMASDIAGSISRLSSHLTANYLSSSGWLQTDTNLRSKTLSSCVWNIVTKKTPNQIFHPPKKITQNISCMIRNLISYAWKGKKNPSAMRKTLGFTQQNRPPKNWHYSVHSRGFIESWLVRNPTMQMHFRVFWAESGFPPPPLLNVSIIIWKLHHGTPSLTLIDNIIIYNPAAATFAVDHKIDEGSRETGKRTKVWISKYLRQMTDPHAKPRNYAVVIMVIISSSSSNSVFLLQTVVLPIASGQERRNASNMIHRYSLCSWTFGEQQAMVWRKTKTSRESEVMLFLPNLLSACCVSKFS